MSKNIYIFITFFIATIFSGGLVQKANASHPTPDDNNKVCFLTSNLDDGSDLDVWLRAYNSSETFINESATLKHFAGFSPNFQSGSTICFTYIVPNGATYFNLRVDDGDTAGQPGWYLKRYYIISNNEVIFIDNYDVDQNDATRGYIHLGDIDGSSEKQTEYTQRVRRLDMPPPGYSYCAAEGEVCNFSGNKDVKYAVNGNSFSKNNVSGGGIQCSNSAIGFDPLPGYQKSCYIMSTTPPPPPPSTCSNFELNPSTHSTFIYIFEDSNRGGNCTGFGHPYPTYSTSYSDLGSLGYNDKISSVWVPAGYSLVLYRDINFGGDSVTFNNDSSSNMDVSHDEWASSMKLYAPPPPASSYCSTTTASGCGGDIARVGYGLTGDQCNDFCGNVFSPNSVQGCWILAGDTNCYCRSGGGLSEGSSPAGYCPVGWTPPPPPPDTPPSITSEPESQTVNEPARATFSVVATGSAPLSYQWYKYPDAISGATSSTYMTPSTTTADNGSQYFVLVQNSAGWDWSGYATLYVNPPQPPTITAHPQDQTVNVGQSASFSVSASGTGTLSYQWVKDGSNISNATSSSYSTGATTYADNGQLYVVVSDTYGYTPSNVASLTVNSKPFITTQPVAKSIVTGQTATFTVIADGTPTLIYQWGKNNVDISGATNSSYTTPPAVLADNGTKYKVTITNIYGNVTSSEVNLAVTQGPPSVETVAVSAVTTIGATINGSANPNGATATGWFRYSTTSPGICNDTFGIRVPSSGGTALGAGTSTVAYSQPLTGLTLSTVYYFCALASNSAGTSVGSVFSFTTVGLSTKTLNATGNPKTLNSTGWFRYCKIGDTDCITVPPSSCNDTFGIRAPASAGSALGAGTNAVGFNQGITGLTPGTNYFFCAIGQNSAGTSFGEVLSFTASSPSPIVTTVAASSITTTSATINGTGNPNGDTTTGWFRYSPTSQGTCNDTFGIRAPSSGGDALGSGQLTNYSEPITGLSPNTTYYFCAIASNAGGKGFGSVLNFTTLSPPTATTIAASSPTPTTATLNATGDPNGFATTGWFRYHNRSTGGACADTDAFGTRAPSSGGDALGAGSSAVAYNEPITGLSPNTTYYFCAIGFSSIGTGFGSVLNFTTPAIKPEVTSAAASSITSTSATLNGTGNPHNSTTIGWFRYHNRPTAGTCADTDAFGIPFSGSLLGSDSSVVAYSKSITGLAYNTTYHFCAIASNFEGTSFGAVLNFKTLAVPPTVTIVAASSITQTSATLNGTGNPNNATSTGWFRYHATPPSGVCTDTGWSGSTRVPTSGGDALGADSSAVAYNEPITGLSPNTTYYFCAIASNFAGTSFTDYFRSVKTLPIPPTVATGAGTDLLATHNPSSPYSSSGSYNTVGYSIVPSADGQITGLGGYFNGTKTVRLKNSSNTLLASASVTSSLAWTMQSITSVPVTAGQTYWVEIVTAGGGWSFFPKTSSPTINGVTMAGSYYCSGDCNISSGSVDSNHWYGAPDVRYSSVTPTNTTLNGSVNPNGASSTGWFRYDTINPGTCDDTFGTRAPSSGGDGLGTGSSAVAYNEPITGLSPNTIYYFCAIGSNSGGTSVGSVQNFTTVAVAPTMETSAVSPIGKNSATLNGTGNPNNSISTGWFRYHNRATAGTCADTDAFGTRVPFSGGDNLGSGGSSVAYSEPIAGLLSSTTYYFCAIGSNSVGTAVGSVLDFTTDSIIGPWTARTSGTTVNITSISYSPTLSRFVIGMSNGTTRYSTDSGVTWTAGGTVPLGAGGSAPVINNLTWSSAYNVFVATGTQTIATTATASVWTSANGTTWSTPTSGAGSNGALAAGGSILIAGNGSGTTGRSTNGTSWTAGGTAGTVTHRGAAFGAGLFVLVGDAGTIYTSTLGISWTARASGTTTGFSHVAYSPTLGVFLASTINGSVVRISTDGITWTAGSTGASTIATNKTRWISSAFVTATSGNGIFNLRETPTSPTITVTTGAIGSPADIATNGSVVVGVHDGGQIYTAPLNP